VRKKPSEERGPNVTIEIEQAHNTSTTGVRQVKDLTVGAAMLAM
jgi:hypothetical protein